MRKDVPLQPVLLFFFCSHLDTHQSYIDSQTCITAGLWYIHGEGRPDTCHSCRRLPRR